MLILMAEINGMEKSSSITVTQNTLLRLTELKIRYKKLIQNAEVSNDEFINVMLEHLEKEF